MPLPHCVTCWMHCGPDPLAMLLVLSRCLHLPAGVVQSSARHSFHMQNVVLQSFVSQVVTQEVNSHSPHRYKFTYATHICPIMAPSASTAQQWYCTTILHVGRIMIIETYVQAMQCMSYELCRILPCNNTVEHCVMPVACNHHGMDAKILKPHRSGNHGEMHVS